MERIATMERYNPPTSNPSEGSRVTSKLGLCAKYAHMERLRRIPTGYTYLRKLGYSFPARTGSGRGDFPNVNHFAVNTLWLSGGGDRRGLPQHLGYHRCGGSKCDMHLGLKHFDRMPKNGRVRHSAAEICELLKLPTDLQPMSVRKAWMCAPFKKDANPGPLLSSLGYRKKGECENLIRTLALMTEESLHRTGKARPIHFGMAGRPGLHPVNKVMKRCRENLPLGRLIWVADAWEPPVAQKFLRPILKVLRKNHPHIKIGHNKFNRDRVKEDGERLWGYDVYINLDYSKFDASLPRTILERVGEVIKTILRIARQPLSTG